MDSKTDYRMNIQRLYDRVGTWFYSFFFIVAGYRAAIRDFLRREVDRLGIETGIRVLDAGIGTGFLTINLLKSSRHRLRVTGLDFSRGMQADLKKRLLQAGVRNHVTLLQADIQRIPLAGASFDLVVSSAAIEYLSDIETGIAEMARVLRPGGKLLIIATRSSPMGKFVAAIWKNKALDPDRMIRILQSHHIRHIRRLSFGKIYFHINAWGMILVGEKEKLLS